MKIEILAGQVVATSETKEDVLALIALSGKKEAGGSPAPKGKRSRFASEEARKAHKRAYMKRWNAKRRKELQGQQVPITHLEA